MFEAVVFDIGQTLAEYRTPMIHTLTELFPLFHLSLPTDHSSGVNGTKF